MNKINLILAASLLPLTLSATSANTYFSGGYIGGGFGSNRFSSTQKFNFDPTKVANVWKYNLNHSSTNSSLLGQLFLGYGYLFASKPVYVAIEAIADFSQPSSLVGTSDLTINVKQNNAYGGRVKLGYVRHDSLLYVLAGVEGASIKSNINFINGGIYNSLMMTLQNINSNSSASLITQVGAGINLALSSTWQGQLEYDHNFYNNKNYGLNHQFITFNNPKGTYTSSLEGDQVSVGIKYRWKQ